MPRPSIAELETEKLARVDRLQEAIAVLEAEIERLLSSGEVAPLGAWVARDQVRQPHKTYWYYKLQTPDPNFRCSTQKKLSKYKHLGKAGSQAHIEAVISVGRRTMLNELTKMIENLKQNLLDVGFDGESEEP